MNKHKSSTESKNKQDSTISRRDILLGVGAVGAMAISGDSLASTEHKHGHSKHSTQQTELLDAVNTCLDKTAMHISLP